MRKHIATLLVLAFAAGCSFHARSTEDYKADTRKLLSTKDAEIKACYDQHLATNPAQSGKVVVNFTVEKKTGKVGNVAVDPKQSTAPESLQACVTGAIKGLTLKPEDRRDGDATFTWVFKGAS